MADLADDIRRRHADGPLTIAVWLSLVAVVPPYLRVIDSGPWTIGVAVIDAALLGVGFFARRRRLPAIAVSLLELLAWTLLVTLVFFRDTAFLWVIPTGDTVEAVRQAFAAAQTEIQNGAAPIPAGAAMSFLLVAAMGLLAIVIDHTVLSARLPLLAAVGLIAVTLIPPVVVPAPVDVVAFVFLAGAILLTVRAETRGRQRALQPPAPRRSPQVMSAAAFGIGAVALVVTLVVTPLLPQPTEAGPLTPGSGATISADLALGDDLRRPREVEVLNEWTSGTAAPYLRAATLTNFDGSVWQPDQQRGVPIAEEDALGGGVVVNQDIQVDTVTTTVTIENLASPWLPVSSPAVRVDGLQGDGWTGVAYNRTVISGVTDSQHQTYTVTSQVPRPTLDQIRALSATAASEPTETVALPVDTPPIIGDLARQVTAGATSDYDKLVALQSWFRGPDFTYSLDAPVADGFDGSGAEAIAEFLTNKSGYCIHFASAFALMARTLGMPSRIVVGYLPGTPTTNEVDKQVVYTVMSGQLHAWPEVYFDGLGWVPFEPTKSLGVPTAFSATITDSGDVDPSAITSTPSATATPDSALRPDEGETTDASGTTSVDPAPGLWVLFAGLLVLLVPALVRRVVSGRAVAAARRGDAVAAWQEARSLALDLGLPVSASDSPRAVGVRLVAAGAPSDAVAVLVRAIERASYAPDARADAAVPRARRFALPWVREAASTGDASPPAAASFAAPPAPSGPVTEPDALLADAVLAVHRSLFDEASRARAALAVLAPRSLVIRPASASVPSP